MASEEDVEYIISHDTEASDKVRYYGFRNLIRKDNDGLIKPTLYFRKFILYKSGKTFCKRIDCQSINEHHASSLFEITADIQDEYNWYLNLYGLKTAKEKGLQFPNCYLCQHYCYNEDNDSFECEIKKSIIEKGSDALTCNSYVFKPNALDRIEKQFIPLGGIDTWSR